MAVALNERGIFTWGEWSKTLGLHVANVHDAADPEAYWRAWLTALEDILGAKSVGSRAALLDLKEAWREAAEHTPHGQPIELAGGRGGGASRVDGRPLPDSRNRTRI
jgi:hypothetical protein